MSEDCFVCRKHRGEIADPGRVYEDELTYVGHLVPPEGTGAYLGHLFVEPKRHAEVGDLTDEEAAAVGVAVNRAARALRSIGAAHVYLATIGHGVPHVHVHVVPRWPETPDDVAWHRVDEWEGARRGGADEIAAFARRLPY